MVLAIRTWSPRCGADGRADARKKIAVYTPGVVSSVRRPSSRMPVTEETTPGVYTAVFFRASALPAPPQRGDQVRIASTSYKVVDVNADAEGGVRLVLHKI